MHVALSLLLTFVCLSASGQPVNLLSKDESGIYKHALDSVISTIQGEQPLRVLYIDAPECVLNYLPDTIQSVAIVTDKMKVKKRNKARRKTDELVLSVGCGEIKSDQVVFSIIATQPSKWIFVFGYEFIPGPKNPKLIYVSRGPIEFQ